MLLGAWVAVLLFLGFPTPWNKAFAVASGLIIIIAGYLLKPEIAGASASHHASKPHAHASPAHDAPYIEHKNDSSTN